MRGSDPDATLYWLAKMISIVTSGFIGVVVLSAHKTGSGDVSIVPILAACSATACYGVAACAMKKWLSGVRPLVVATGSQIWASLFLLPFSLATLPEAMPSPKSHQSLFVVMTNLKSVHVIGIN